MTSQQRPVIDSLQGSDKLYVYDNLNGITAVVPVSVLIAYLASIAPPPPPPTVAGDPFAGYSNIDQTIFRNPDTEYTNTTANTMIVIAALANNGNFTNRAVLVLTGRVNGAVTDYYVASAESSAVDSTSITGKITLHVPPGATYQIDASSTINNVPTGTFVFAWTEFTKP